MNTDDDDWRGDKSEGARPISSPGNQYCGTRGRNVASTKRCQIIRIEAFRELNLRNRTWTDG